MTNTRSNSWMRVKYLDMSVLSGCVGTLGFYVNDNLLFGLSCVFVSMIGGCVALYFLKRQ